jgi:outer membrane protein TolC
VKQSFYTVLLAQQMVRINQEAYAVIAAHLKVSQALYNEGKMSNYDVSRVKVQLANQKTSLIKAQNNLKITVDALIIILGWEPSLETDFVGQLGYVEKPVKGYEEGLMQALGKRIEIRQLLLQEEAVNSLVSLARGGHLPNLLLNSIFSRQNSSGFGADQSWTNSWTTTVSLTIPLFEGFATNARIDQAKSQKEQILLTKAQLIDSIKIEVKQAYFTLDQAKDNIAGQSENVDTAKDNLRIAQERYKLGLMSDIEVRDAELTLTQAEINYYQATFEYITALAKVEKAIAETLE